MTGAVTANDGPAKEANVVFDWKDLNDAETINVPVPAGAVVLEVKLVVDVGFTSTGSNTITVGDGSDPDGYITAAVATTAAMATAGATINSTGLYAFGGTDTTARELKVYASADTLDLASGQTDWLSGKATLKVLYV
jgi:hypothetical protein